jgi:hypothetical protein
MNLDWRHIYLRNNTFHTDCLRIWHNEIKQLDGNFKLDEGITGVTAHIRWLYARIWRCKVCLPEP